MARAHRIHTLLAVLGMMIALPFSAAGPAGAQVSIREADGKPLVVELGSGVLMRLAKPVASVFIANPEIADVTAKSPRLIYVFGKLPGQTTFYAVDDQENVIAAMPMRVNHAISRLNEAIRNIAPQAQVQASSIDGGIVLVGSVPYAADIDNIQRVAARYLGPEEEVISRVDVTEAHQVNLRVRVAEVARDVIKEFGINWNVAVEGAITFGLITGGGVAGGAVNAAFANATPGPTDINTFIDALADDGLVTVLAEPNLTALSGETATFLAGGEFPIPISQDDNDLTIEFKQFGVSLAFTPTVLKGGRISLRVRPEVSQLSTNGAININGLVIPALAVRRAETTVELASGQSFAIAGLLLERREHNADSVPGLSDLPILGALFNSDSFRREETELVIIVTPYLVRPVSDPATLSAPTDAYDKAATPPATVSLLPGGLQTVPLAAATGSGLTGPAGFLIE